MQECVLDGRAQCVSCGLVYRGSRHFSVVHRACTVAVGPDTISARLTICRTCPEFGDPADPIRVYSQRDIGRTEAGQPCIAAAVRAWQGRISGENPPCERHAC
jgi:hypothetical protein